MKQKGLMACVVGAVVMVLALLCAGIISQQQIQKAAETRQLVIRTQDLLRLLEMILSLMKDAENGERGYILTGDSKDLVPYKSARLLVPPLLKQLDETVADNADERAHIALLKPLILSQFKELQSAVDARTEKGFAAAQAISTSSLGYQNMQQIRSIILAMTMKEQDPLAQRMVAMDGDTDSCQQVLGILVGTAVGSLVVTALLMIRFLKEKQKMQELASRKARESIAARNHLDAVLSNMGDGLYQLDANGKLVFLNKAAERILGYTQAELKGKNMHDAMHYRSPESEGEGNHHRCPLLGVAKSGTPYSEEQDHFVRKDGTFVPVRYVSSPVIVDGENAGAVLSFSDMTEQRKAESRVHAHAAVTEVLATADDTSMAVNSILQVICDELGWELGVFWTPTQDMTMLHCGEQRCQQSAELESFLEITKSKTYNLGEGLPGRVWESRKPAHVTEVGLDLAPRAQQARELGLSSAFAFPVMFYDEIFGVLEFFSKEKRESDPELGQVLIAISSQIGLFMARRRAAEELVSTQERLNLAVKGAQDGIWDWDIINNTCFYSPRCRQMLGYDENELRNTPEAMLDVTHPDDVQRVKDGLAAHLSSGAPYDLEVRIKCKDGHYKWIHTRGEALREAGQAVRMAGSYRDISERKEVERRMAEFYSAVSYEMRTPLSSIRSSLILMEGGRTGDLPQKATQLVKIARTESDRLIRLVNDILDIEKIEAGKMQLELQTISCDQIVSQAVNETQAMAQQFRIKLRHSIDSARSIRCDSDRTVQVLTSFITNAIKFSEAEDEVIITVSDTNGKVRFSVKDKGPGIPKDQVPKLFQFYQQLEPSESRPQGPGLGLAIAKALVVMQGGNIGVDTDVEEGSTFWFELPKG